MSVIIHLPAALEQRLRTETTDLDAQAKEALLVELYRQDKLSHRELAQGLGIDRLQTEAILKKHHVTEDLLTRQEYESALAHLNAEGEG